MNMDISKNTKKEILEVLIIFSYAFFCFTSAIFLLKRNFNQFDEPFIPLSEGIDLNIPINKYFSGFFFDSLSFDSMAYIGIFESELLISIYKILTFIISISFVIIIIFKAKFLKCENKFDRSLQYMFISTLVLILGILNYYGGALDKLTYDIDIYEDEIYNVIYYVKIHDIKPILYGITFIILDIPFLIAGISECKMNKSISKNKKKVSLKNRVKYIFDDMQSFAIVSIIIISIFCYLFSYTSRGIYFYDVNKIIIK